MAIDTLEHYKEALVGNREVVAMTIPTATVVAGRTYDLWRVMVPLGSTGAGAGQTYAVASDGGLVETFPSSGQSSIIGARFNGLNPGNYIIADRVYYRGDLSGTFTTEQGGGFFASTGSRYTDGVGLMMALTIYTQIGTTATTVSARYVNQDGTGSRVTPLVAFGGTGFREANRMILLPLQSGDTGIQSIDGVTVTATTGTAGAFGVTVFKPLYVIAVDSAHGVLSAGGFISGNTCGGVAKIETDACLFPISITQGVTPMGAGALIVHEN